MKIKGLLASEAHCFHPEQWLNLWQLDPVCNDCVFYCVCQAQDIESLLRNHDPEDFGLEPTDAEGNPQSIPSALATGHDYLLDCLWAEAHQTLGEG